MVTAEFTDFVAMEKTAMASALESLTISSVSDVVVTVEQGNSVAFGRYTPD